MGLLSKAENEKGDSSSGEDDQLLYQGSSGPLMAPPTFIGFRQDSLAEKQSVLCFEEHIWRGKESAFEITDDAGKVIALYSGERHSWRVSRSHHEISDPEGNYLYNLVRKNMRTLDTIEGSDPQNGDKLLFRVNRKMSMRHSKVNITLFDPSSGAETILYLRGRFKKGNATLRLGDDKAGQVVAHSARDPTSSRKYRVTIAPGVDLTFMAALWVCIDEAMNDTDANQAAYISAIS